MSWLTDINNDIRAGLIRVLTTSEENEHWAQVCEQEHHEAETIADQYHWSPLALDYQIRRHMCGMFDHARLHLFRLAYGLAMEREEERRAHLRGLLTGRHR